MPTIAEAGLPDYEYVAWFGVFAPGTTRPEKGALCIDLAASVAKIRRRNGDLFLVKWPDCHRCNRNRADGGVGISRKGGSPLLRHGQQIRLVVTFVTGVSCGALLAEAI